MDRKTFKKILMVIGLLSLFSAVYGQRLNIGFENIVAFPFVQLAGILRWMSLTSSLGNVIALVIYGFVCSVPSMILLRKRFKNTLHREDLLLALLSCLLFVSFYFMINPGYMVGRIVPEGMGDFGSFMLGSVIYITLSCYVILRFIRRFNGGEEKLLDCLARIMEISLVILIIAICWMIPSETLLEFELLRQSNTMTGMDFGLTDTFIILRALVGSILLVFDIWILWVGLELIEHLKVDRFNESISSIFKRIEQICMKSIVTYVLATVSINVLQLMVAKDLLVSDFNIEIPMTQLMIVLITMLLSRYFAESRKIKEENDLFV